MNALVIGVIVAVVLVVGFWTVRRLRRGGPGPQVNSIPRFMRGKVNEQFEKHGWQEPYDENGDRNPDRDGF